MNVAIVNSFPKSFAQRLSSRGWESQIKIASALWEIPGRILRVIAPPERTMSNGCRKLHLVTHSTRSVARATGKGAGIP
jgi:hypothetical protein